MGKKSKTIFFIVFILIILYTGYGILQLGEQGGPCNSGIAIIVLMPFLLICVALLATTFSWLTFSTKTNFKWPIIFSIISLLIWTYWFYVFSEDSIKDSLLYLGLFELLNILFVLFFVQKTMKNKADKNLNY